jgi:formylmethanofuran dehydrogenase subunit B
MAVAWIGSRETLVERAAAHAGALLGSSRCPVFSFDTDIHGTRAAIALAERIGAAYDHAEGAALAREAALFTTTGAMTVSPGEVRRRADMVTIVGELPEAYHGWLAELAGTVPDLSPTNAREFFVVGAGAPPFPNGRPAAVLSCGNAGLGAILGALRAQCAGRKVSRGVAGFDGFAGALATARFPVFLFSGRGADGPALDMLQGLVADLNRKGRASSLFLPANESGWGSALASTWMTGFAPRTGFPRGLPEYDPWRFDVSRMIAAGEADLHLAIRGRALPDVAGRRRVRLIALARTDAAIPGAAVTIAIGEAGVDHDSVGWSARTGTLASVAARAASGLPSAASVVRAIAAHVSNGAPLPC